MALGFFHLSALAAVQNVAASDITDEQLAALNTQLVEKDVTGITAVRDTDAAKLGTIPGLNAQITTLTSQLATVTRERDDAKAEAARFGSQPGAVASRTQSTQESIGTQAEGDVSDTDAELRRMKAAVMPMPVK